jgi:hypothetical protein
MASSPTPLSTTGACASTGVALVTEGDASEQPATVLAATADDDSTTAKMSVATA